MSEITVELAPGLAQWGHGDSEVVLVAGQAHAVDLTNKKELRAAVAAAVAAGSLVLKSGQLSVDAHVQSQEDGETAYAKAQEAIAPLFETRDRRLRGQTVRELTEDDRREIAAQRLGVEPDELTEHDLAEQVPPSSTIEYAYLAADRGSDYHAELVATHQAMAELAQKALED